MDYLLARIKTRKSKNLRLAISEQTIYPDLETDNSMEYNDEQKLQEGEWFVLHDFSKKDYCPDWMKQDFNIMAYNQLDKGEHKEILYLIAIQNEYDDYCFQWILSHGRILRKRFFTFSEQPKLQEYENLLVINDQPDAIYRKSEDNLYFRDLGRTKHFFSGIEELYREATDAEVDNFLGIDIIQLSNNFEKSKVKVPNRRKIRAAQKQYDKFDEAEKTKLKAYIAEFCCELKETKDGKSYEIGSDNQLRELLNAIDQRYYSTPIGNEKRVATSVQKV